MGVIEGQIPQQTEQTGLVTRRAFIGGGLTVAVATLYKYFRKKLQLPDPRETPIGPRIEDNPRFEGDIRGEVLLWPEQVIVNGSPLTLPHNQPDIFPTPESADRVSPQQCSEVVVDNILNEYIRALSNADKLTIIGSNNPLISVPDSQPGTVAILPDLSVNDDNPYYSTIEHPRSSADAVAGVIGTIQSIYSLIKSAAIGNKVPEPTLEFATRIYNELISKSTILPRETYKKEVNEVIDISVNDCVAKLFDPEGNKRIFVSCTPSPDETFETRTSGRKMFSVAREKLLNAALEYGLNVLSDSDREITLSNGSNILKFVLPKDHSNLGDIFDISEAYSHIGVLTDEVQSGHEISSMVLRLADRWGKSAEDCYGDFEFNLWTAFASTWPTPLVNTISRSVLRGNSVPRKLNIHIENTFNSWIDTISQDLLNEYQSVIGSFRDRQRMAMDLYTNPFGVAGILRSIGSANEGLSVFYGRVNRVFRSVPNGDKAQVHNTRPAGSFLGLVEALIQESRQV